MTDTTVIENEDQQIQDGEITHDTPQPRQEVTVISEPVDPSRGRGIPVTRDQGGLTFQNYGEVIEFAKMMSTTGWALPPHLRKSQTGCLAVCTRAGWWRLDPYFVAEHSYLVKSKGGIEKLAFDSSVFQAVINSRAPIKHRLKHRFEGEGNDMVCIVWTTFLGESVPTEHRLPTLEQRMKQAHHSPLWESKVRVQFAYDTIRDFARLYCQDVLGGIYDKDELIDLEDAVEVQVAADAEANSPHLLDRLPGRVDQAANLAETVTNGVNGDHPAQDTQKGGKASQTPKQAQGGTPRTGKGASKTPAPSSKATPTKAKPAAPVKASAKPEKSGRDWTKKPPTRPKEYIQYLTDWMGDLDAPSDIMTRFGSAAERKVRNAAGMVSEDTAEAKKLIERRIESL